MCLLRLRIDEVDGNLNLRGRFGSFRSHNIEEWSIFGNPFRCLSSLRNNHQSIAILLPIRQRNLESITPVETKGQEKKRGINLYSKAAMKLETVASSGKGQVRALEIPVLDRSTFETTPALLSALNASLSRYGMFLVENANVPIENQTRKVFQDFFEHSDVQAKAQTAATDGMEQNEGNIWRFKGMGKEASGAVLLSKSTLERIEVDRGVPKEEAKLPKNNKPDCKESFQMGPLAETLDPKAVQDLIHKGGGVMVEPTLWPLTRSNGGCAADSLRETMEEFRNESFTEAMVILKLLEQGCQCTPGSLTTDLFDNTQGLTSTKCAYYPWTRSLPSEQVEKLGHGQPMHIYLGLATLIHQDPSSHAGNVAYLEVWDPQSSSFFRVPPSYTVFLIGHMGKHVMGSRWRACVHRVVMSEPESQEEILHGSTSEPKEEKKNNEEKLDSTAKLSRISFISFLIPRPDAPLGDSGLTSTSLLVDVFSEIGSAFAKPDT